jgi:hypothetical protein
MAFELLQRRASNFQSYVPYLNALIFLLPFLFIILISCLALVSVGARLKSALFIYSCLFSCGREYQIYFLYIFLVYNNPKIRRV